MSMYASVAQRKERSNKRTAFTLAAGRNVRLAAEGDPLGSALYLAVAEIGGATSTSGAGGNDVVRSAAELTATAMQRYLKDMVIERDVVFWASASKAVLARRQRRLGCLVLEERSTPVSDAQALPALLQGFKEMGGVNGVGLSKELEAWRQRVIWLRAQAAPPPPPSTKSKQQHQQQAEVTGSSSGSKQQQQLASLPDLSDAGLLASAGRWLAPHLGGVRSKGDMLKLPWGSIIKSLVPRELQQLVEQEAPSHLVLPTGTRALVDYGRDPPTVQAKLQEVFGLPRAPRLAGGRIALTLELLSPGMRPLAVTSDLASFWANSYADMRKEMRGAYPRHIWPDNPLEAEATRLTKRQTERAEAAAAAAAPAGGSSGGGGKGGAAASKGSGKAVPAAKGGGKSSGKR